MAQIISIDRGKTFQGIGIRLPNSDQQEELRRIGKEIVELKIECDI